MPAFVSFAQNFEDVMLWRALKHVERGFYIDIGAYSPVVDSVTQAFYQRGWRGINVEPQPDCYRELLAARKLDVNLAVAVADETKELTMSFVSNPGLSTLNEWQAKQRLREGHSLVRQKVQVDTLDAIWTAHVPVNQPVHFLKIDVEGLEREVLLGNDWEAHRPWIVIVEATAPTTPKPSYVEWEGILTGARYFYAYFDGLNRFYVASEHRDLAMAFRSPPNVFDDFIRASEVQASERAARAERELMRAERELMELRATRSWRWTSPLRASGALRRRVGVGWRRGWRTVRKAISAASPR